MPLTSINLKCRPIFQIPNEISMVFPIRLRTNLLFKVWKFHYKIAGPTIANGAKQKLFASENFLARKAHLKNDKHTNSTDFKTKLFGN